MPCRRPLAALVLLLGSALGCAAPSSDDGSSNTSSADAVTAARTALVVVNRTTSTAEVFELRRGTFVRSVRVARGASLTIEDVSSGDAFRASWGPVSSRQTDEIVVDLQMNDATRRWEHQWVLDASSAADGSP